MERRRLPAGPPEPGGHRRSGPGGACSNPAGCAPSASTATTTSSRSSSPRWLPATRCCSSARRAPARPSCSTRSREALGLEHRHYNASLIAFDDLVGFPFPDGERASIRYIETPATVWQAESVLIDEISRCKPEHQNRLFSLVHERRIQGIEARAAPLPLGGDEPVRGRPGRGRLLRGLGAARPGAGRPLRLRHPGAGLGGSRGGGPRADRRSRGEDVPSIDEMGLAAAVERGQAPVRRRAGRTARGGAPLRHRR